MQVTETASNGLKREYKVVVAAEDMATRIGDRLAELQRTVQLKGFRPGKAPVDLLKRRFGEAVVSEVVQKTLQDTSGEVIDRQGVRPAVQPSIEDMSFDEGKDLEYVMAVEVMPEIEAGDFSSYELENLTIAVDDGEVGEALERLRERNKTFEEAAEGHAARTGDAVRIDFTGTIDGETFAGGSAEDHLAEIGSGRMFPEFEASLEGKKAGDSYTVEAPFPDDYGAEHLAGKTARFEVAVKEVRTASTPDLDDAFAKSQGAEDLDGLRDRMSERLTAEYRHVGRQRLKRLLLDKLSGAYSFDVPPSLVDNEFDSIWRQVEREPDHRHGEGGDDGHDRGEPARDEKREEMRTEYRAIAERRVRLGLLLSEIGRAHDIQVTPEDMQQAVIERARQFPGQEAKVVQYYQENPQAMQALTAPILEDRVVDRILTQVTLKERGVTPSEFFEIDSQAEESGKDEGKTAGKTSATGDPAADGSRPDPSRDEERNTRQ